MSEVLISKVLIENELYELEQEMAKYQDPYIALKIDTLNWVLENGTSNMESMTWNELRMKHRSKSDESMGNWLRRAYPKGLIVRGKE
jgi:hypothetical protein